MRVGVVGYDKDSNKRAKHVQNNQDKNKQDKQKAILEKEKAFIDIKQKLDLEQLKTKKISDDELERLQTKKREYEQKKRDIEEERRNY